MSIRFRRTMKIAPGVHLNFNKNSIGLSLGPRGAHYTMNTSGRRTVSAGIPGTGIYAFQTLSGGKRATTTRHQELTQPPEIIPPSPGLLASKLERYFYAFLQDVYDPESKATPKEYIEKAKALEIAHPALKYPLNLLSFVHAATSPDFSDKIVAWGKEVWGYRDAAFMDPLAEKYFTGMAPVTHITRGIATHETFNKQVLGFIWAEVLQSQDMFDEAIEVLHEMIPDQLVAISIADIELSQGKFDEAIETTEDIENVDDATAMLLILRGVAFREKNLNDAAVECFKRAMSHKDRSEGVMHRALFERADSYARMGKKALAIKDLEKIMVDEPGYPEVEAKIAEINK